MIESGYKEGLYYAEELGGFPEETEKQIRELLSENHGVGIIGGYYEDEFPICMVSELTVKMLGYSSADELLNASCKNMNGLVSGGLNAELAEKFKNLNGADENYLRGKNGDLWVRLAKRDVVVNGKRLWLASVCDMDALYRKELQVNKIILEKREQELLQQEKLARANAELEKKNEELQRALSEAELNNEIISVIGKAYWLIYRLDLTTGTYEGVSVGEEKHRFTDDRGITAERFPEACKRTVSPEYREIMLGFLNIGTLADRLSNKEEISQEYRTVTGNWHVGRFIVQRRNENGKAVKALYTIKIINEQKKQENEYEKRLTEIAEEAQKASLSKSDFLRRMSHDIRTPINGIRGMIEIANDCADDPEKQKECRAKIWEASGYLLSLVNSVLDMNKLESGAVVLASIPFDLTALLAEINAVAEMQAVEHGVCFRVNTEKRNIKHNYLIGSPSHVKQVLMNIAGNAVKYNKENGSVRVWSKETSCENGFAVFDFYCEDTGIGMSEEFQKHAFEPFAQEGKNNARSLYAGTGLGLSIVKALVGQMNGHIEFKSKEGVGTTFRVTLPFKIDEKPTVCDEASEETPDLNGLKVLVAEDNELNLEIACFFLKKAGAETVEVRDGLQAVKIFESSKEGEFDVILMDVMMPLVGGYEATRTIRGSGRSDSGVPIIAMSANAFEDDIEKSKNAGMNEHFPKPLDMKKLLKAVKKYAAKK